MLHLSEHELIDADWPIGALSVQPLSLLCNIKVSAESTVAEEATRMVVSSTTPCSAFPAGRPWPWASPSYGRSV